ncbi:uncharacterized protein [Diadema antillarum]|uniref:uncharacterized protein n=1 Tax=Diadema antillarum TaxID=105358 RepID=UPI003A8A3068
MHQRGHVPVVGEAPPASYDRPATTQCDQPSRPQEDAKKPAPPFLYNWHVLPVALPGVVFVTAMTGELLLTILTVGALLIYLMLSGGAERNAVIAYICIFIAAQMSALYSCLPLVWISPVNAPLLVLLNMFLVMTGGWGLVQMKFFIADQPILAQTIETGLFSLYPVVSLGLTTWLASYLISVRFAVYLAIFYGFLLMRIFMTPATSSFHKLNPQWKRKQILEDAEVAAVLIVYSVLPISLFFLSHVMAFLQGSVSAMMELVLVALLPPFLITFIQLRSIYEKCNITPEQVSLARRTAGLCVLLLPCLILHQSGISAATIWLLPTVTCYTLLGFSLSRGNHFWVGTALIAMLTACLSIFVILSAVPVTIDILLISPHLLVVILIINALAVLACVLSAGTGKKYSAYFSLCLLLQSVVFVHSESLLLARDLYSPPLALLTTLVQFYTITRLNTVRKLTKQIHWLICSVHAMKLPFFVQVALIVPESETLFGFMACYSSLAVAVIMLRILVYEEGNELQPTTVTVYAICATGAGLTFLINVARPAIRQLFGGIGFLPLVLFNLLATSLAMCKLTLMNMHQSPRGARISGVFVALSSFLLLLQAPMIHDLLSPWHLMMLASAVTLQLACVSSLLEPPNPRLFALVGGVLIGIPLGSTYCTFLYKDVTLLATMMLKAVSVEAVIVILLLWRYSIEWRTKNLVQCTVDRFLHGTFIMFAVCSTMLFGLEVHTLAKLTPLWEALLTTSSGSFLCVVCGGLSIAIRLFCLKWNQQDPFSFQPGLLPTYGNLVTMATYILAILTNPIQFPEIWNSASSVILLCLQQDPKIFPSIKTMTRIGVIFAACVLNLALFSFSYSLLIVEGVGIFSIMELLGLLLTLPILVIMVQDLSQPVKYVFPEHSVILWAPVGCVLFVFGSSYASWLLSATSFISGMLLLQRTSLV